MEKKFHITIADNETGEIIQEADTCAIVGGYTTDNGATGILLTHSNVLDHARAVNAAEHAVSDSYQKHPEVKLAALLISAVSTTEEK